MINAIYAIIALAALLGMRAAAQQVIPISQGGLVGGMTCAETIELTDSNSNNGNYGPGEAHTITLCVVSGAVTNAQFVISPAIFGHTWDVDENSSLFLYDGPDTFSPLIGEFNTANSPSGIFFTATGLCVTLTFISGNESSGAGFTALFRCLQPLQPFVLNVQSDPPMSPWNNLPHPSIRLCFGNDISLNAITDYPLSNAGGNGYVQNDATTLFRWDMGDGTFYQGQGLTSLTHSYTNPAGYLVTLIATDQQGQGQIFQFFVLFAPRPVFSNLVVEDTLCVGQTTVITGGILGTDTVGVSPSTSAIFGGGSLGLALYLPDGNNTNYVTSITITDFEEGQVVTDLSDIISICVNMEHSYLGDLEMAITCPNGTTVVLFDANGGGIFPGGCNGGGTFLGDANDSGPNGVPGIGLDYCFATTATWGTICQELAAGNTIPVSSFPPGGNAMAPGTYQPMGNFNNLIGCPLNGDWTLTIRDNLFVDDGWVFNWSIYFHPDINPTTIYYTPQITEVYWAENPDITQNQGTSIVVQPSQPGPNSFTFVVVDEFGCLHDTSTFVYVRPLVVAGPDSPACNLTHILTASNAPAGAQWATISRPIPTAQETFTPINSVANEVVVTEYGFYTFQITENNCNYTDEITIDFRPVPSISPPFVTDTVLCTGAAITFNAGPQPANNGNFIINWTQNGSTFNTQNYSVSVNQTGLYILTISDICGSVADTVNVVTVQIGYNDDIVCGLETFMQATLSPEGTASWSSTAPSVSFSAPNELNTIISSSAYGTFSITLTDTRCPNDGVTREVTFVDQPVLTILPQSPVFCVEKDSLFLSLNVTGSSTGQYFWSVNGQTLNTFGTTVSFPPMEFEPLADYEIAVIGFDDFGVCNVATGAIDFTGEWCTYKIPNVITPNGDGRNDTWNIQFAEFFPGAMVRVYNRWGKLVYEQADYDVFQRNQPENRRGWSPGDDLVEGVYFYEVTLPSIGKVETGNLSILRSNGQGR